MRCAYCNGGCDVRPNHHEAICWRCWYERIGKELAVREWRQQRWWRRLVP